MLELAVASSTALALVLPPTLSQPSLRALSHTLSLRNSRISSNMARRCSECSRCLDEVRRHSATWASYSIFHACLADSCSGSTASGARATSSSCADADWAASGCFGAADCFGRGTGVNAVCNADCEILCQALDFGRNTDAKDMPGGDSLRLD